MWSFQLQMGVSKNRGTPKWMVYNGKPYEQMDDLGGFQLFLETPQLYNTKTWFPLHPATRPIFESSKNSFDSFASHFYFHHGVIL